MGAALIYAGIARVLETESLPLIQAGTSNKIVANSLFFVLIFLVFPPIWDVSAQMMDDVSLWVLNPLYTFDNYMPCPAEWYEEPGRIQREFNESKYRKWFEVNEDVRFEDKRFTERSFGDESTLNTGRDRLQAGIQGTLRVPPGDWTDRPDCRGGVADARRRR